MIEHKIQIVPDTEAMIPVQAMVEGTLEEAEVPMKIAMKVDIVVDEIFSNIISYSNAKEVEVICRVDHGQITLLFLDDGIPYNPLLAADPDITLEIEEREIGGLGIFLSKKLMDEVTYEHVDGRNRLHLKKGV